MRPSERALPVFSCDDGPLERKALGAGKPRHNVESKRGHRKMRMHGTHMYHIAAPPPAPRPTYAEGGERSNRDHGGTPGETQGMTYRDLAVKHGAAPSALLVRMDVIPDNEVRKRLQLLSGPTPPAAAFSPPSRVTRRALRCATLGEAAAFGCFTLSLSVGAALSGGCAAFPLRWWGVLRLSDTTPLLSVRRPQFWTPCSWSSGRTTVPASDGSPHVRDHAGSVLIHLAGGFSCGGGSDAHCIWTQHYVLAGDMSAGPFEASRRRGAGEANP